MNRKNSFMSKKSLMAVITVAMLSTFSLAKVNAEPGAGAQRSIEGVWKVTFAPRNCITGMAIPGAEFETLFTFHKGGTLSVWAQTSTIFLTRSPSHGLWGRDRGWSDYSFQFIHLRYELSGIFIGSQDANGTLVLDSSGYEFTAESSAVMLNTDGDQVGVACSTAVGTRY